MGGKVVRGWLPAEKATVTRERVKECAFQWRRGGWGVKGKKKNHPVEQMLKEESFFKTSLIKGLMMR